MGAREDIEKHDNTRPKQPAPAPGRPGAKSFWSTGAKTAVGTAMSNASRVWFTIGAGILNEVYFPDVDCANTNGIRFLVTDGKKFFSDEFEDADHTVSWPTPGVPVFHISTRCKRGRYGIETEVLTDPSRDVLLLNVVFEPVGGTDLHLFLTTNPHLGDRGEKNDAWVGAYKGLPMLFAERKGLTLAVACSSGFTGMSCGFLGKSDSVTDIRAHKRMTRFYNEALGGNVLLTSEINWRARQGRFQLAFACGGWGAEAGQQARAALLQDYAAVRKMYVQGWEATQAGYSDLGAVGDKPDLYRVSVAVMRTHESKRFPGGFVASLSIPWGFARTDKATGGYHVVWPRDLGETALGLLACGDAESARRALFYLHCTQESDGHWNQNMWLDGAQHWTSSQMDGTGFPILIADALRRAGELGDHKPWPMIKAAVGYLVRNGPVTLQDRWEAMPGYSPYTMAVEIVAVLAAAEIAEEQAEPALAEFLRLTADAWNEAIDELTYVSATPTAKRVGVQGYYTRIMPPEAITAKALNGMTVELKNHPPGKHKHKAAEIVSPDALALVRFGLRSANDPRMIDTVQAIDAELKTVTSTGPVWHRYTRDGYGEHPDGSPFDGTGRGRGWPLLTGERAHYEIARGQFEIAAQLRGAMEAQTSECGMIPEQVWDAHDIPRRQLFNGHPSGSGMPLVWAHAEYVKLLRSFKERRVWNMPPQTVQRYLIEKTKSRYQIWTGEQPRAFVDAGKNLRVDSPHALRVRWSKDGWKTTSEVETVDSGLDMRWALLPIADATSGDRIQFYFVPDGDSPRKDKRFEVQVR